MVKSSQHASSNVVSKKNENVRLRIEGKAGNPIWGCPKFGFPKKPDFLFLLLLSLSTTFIPMQLDASTVKFYTHAPTDQEMTELYKDWVCLTSDEE